METVSIKRIVVWVGVAFLFGDFLLVAPTFSAEMHQVRLVGYNDLQGRESLQIVLKGDFA